MHKASIATIIRIFSFITMVLGVVFLMRSAGYGIDTAELQAIFGISDAVFRSIVFALGVFFIVFSINLRQRKQWSRIAALILSSIAIVAGTFFLVRCSELSCTTWLLSMPFNIIRVIIGAFGLWFFGHESTHAFK